MSKNISFENLLNKNVKEINYKDLVSLSNLNDDEASNFFEYISKCSLTEILEIMNKLVQINQQESYLEYESIFKKFLSYPNDIIKISCMKGLSESEDRKLINIFVEIMLEEESLELRNQAAKVLIGFSFRAFEKKLINSDSSLIFDSLFRIISNVNEPISLRMNALESISIFNHESIDEYILYAWNSEDFYSKKSSIVSMGLSGDIKWTNYVIKDLSHEEPKIRCEASKSLGIIGTENELFHLEKLLEDEDLNVQLSTITSIQNIGGDKALNLLEKSLLSPEPLVVEQSKLSIQIIKEEQNLDLVVTPEMAQNLYGSSDIQPGIDLEGYDPLEINFDEINTTFSESNDFGTGITEEAEELGLDRGDPFDIDLLPEDLFDYDEDN
ncbi:MAG: hypothetical protein CL774_04110 [Chloroflexi bacterium]|nr:hypothetical protein [Chloroflexota bacterium]